MIQQTVLGGLNHLLTQADWARVRLQPFAGRQAAFVMPPWRLAFRVSDRGQFEPVGEADTDVTVELPADAPLLALQGIDRVPGSAHVTGNAEFATALSHVFKHLRWDAEEDIARLVGDVAAHRLVKGAETVIGWHRQLADRLAANLSEYLTEEAALAATGRDIKGFSRDVARLRDDTARLEQRLGRFKPG